MTRSQKSRLKMLTGLAALICFAVSPCFACRYSVRDVGFVDFGSDKYKFYGFVNNETPAEIAERLEQIAFATYLDANVYAEIINIDTETEHPALPYFHKHDTGHFPLAVMVSPSERTIPLTFEGEGEELKEAIWDTIQSTVISPKRETMLDKIIEAYCVVVYVEGNDETLNQSAKHEIEVSIQGIIDRSPLMDKPVDVPPQLVVISKDQQKDEQVLLWSLGLSNLEPEEPCAAIVYGRMRRIGNLLVGDMITERNLLNIMGTIGQSCECGLDREWMMGTLLPVTWDSGQQERSVKILQFDAESPMVKAEISQILSINAGRRQGAGIGSIDDLLIGYSETTLEFDNEDASGSTEGQTVEVHSEQEPNISPVNTPIAAKAVSQAAGQPLEPVTGNQSSPFTLVFIALGAIGLLVIAGGLIIVLRAKGGNA